MKRYFFLLLILLIGVYSGKAQIINHEALSDRITGYKMNVVLDPENKSVSGKMEAYWINTGKEEVPDIQMHLYMNAFKSKNSTMYREMGQIPNPKKEFLGWININSFTLDDGTDLLPFVEYIHPDDDNNNDSTVIRILMPQPVFPGDTVKIEIDFVTKLPDCTRRTGYSDDFYFVGQWFPKFGVYEAQGIRNSSGAWNCHQFHANSEFYSDHSVYEVKITTPSEFIVGTGGVLISSEDNGKIKTEEWRADDIVDFAWTAWPGYKVFTDRWKNVDIRLLIPESRLEQVDRQFNSVKNALEFFNDNMGPYPWSHLTIVDPPTIGTGASGMEYTTLFTSQSLDIVPDYLHLPEMVTVHEFGHAYFMGILATNEFEEPWMDEGMNTFFEARIMDLYWGDNSGYIDHPVLKMSDRTVGRLAYVNSPSRQYVTNEEFSWNYPQGSYSMMSYMKSSTWLYSLMGIIGEEAMNEVFREYYKQWAFKHPCATDFIEVVNGVVRNEHGERFGENLDWFFEQTLYGTEICDYRVADISRSRIEVGEGIYRSKVTLARDGDMVLPVEVLVHFDNGDEVLDYWEGKERYKEFEYTGTNSIEWVMIDPEYKNRMDVNFINNSMARKNKNNVPVKSIVNKLMMILQFYFLSF